MAAILVCSSRVSSCIISRAERGQKSEHFTEFYTNFQAFLLLEMPNADL